MKTKREDGKLGFHPYWIFGTPRTADLSALGPGRILLPRKYWRNKNQQDALFFLNFISIIYPLHVSNRITIHHQEALTVYAKYVIYHSENVLKLCKITFIYIYIYALSLKVTCNRKFNNRASR